jgi:DNA-binding transcriptional LysR family regulator
VRSKQYSCGETAVKYPESTDAIFSKYGFGMELRHLRYFIAVAEERHITRAARRLGMQQPPLSQQIRALEAELGVALFIRGARGVELTVAGQTLLEEAYAILHAVGGAETRTRQAASGQLGKLSLGFTTSAALHPLVPRIIHAFRQDYPAVELDLHENAAADLTEAVMRRDIHVALLRVPVAQPPGLVFLELLHEKLSAVLPIGHRLLDRTGKDGLDLRELARERFILVHRPDAPGIYQNLILACRAAGFEPEVVAEVAHMLTNINLVAAGAGISVVPASMREINLRQVGYCRLRTTPRLTAPLTLAYLAENPPPVLLNFIAVSRRLRGDASRPEALSLRARARAPSRASTAPTALRAGRAPVRADGE